VVTALPSNNRSRVRPGDLDTISTRVKRVYRTLTATWCLHSLSTWSNERAEITTFRHRAQTL